MAFSTTDSPVLTTSQPLHLPAPDTDATTDSYRSTVSPTSSGAIVATLLPTRTTPSITDESPVKSKPKKSIPPKKKTYIKPPKINTKKDNALKNTTRNDLPKTKPKKKTNDLMSNHNQEEAGTEKPPANATPKKATPANAAPKKSTPANATPKKSTPANATPKKATPKKSTPANATPKKPVSKKPLPKKAPPKTKPKKDIQPKASTKKPVQAKKNLPKKPNSESQKSQNSGATSNQTKAMDKKMNPQNETLETTTLSNQFQAFTLEPEAITEHLSSTVPSSTSVPLTPVHIGSSEDPTRRANTPLWYLRAATTTPSSFGDATSTQSEDANMSSGTIPHVDVPISNSGDIPVTSGSVLSGDDMTGSFSNVAMISDTMVLQDGLTMVIPTINSEDMTDVASSPWLDQSEFILVNNPVPTSLSDHATVAPTTATRMVNQSTQRPRRRPDETDNNLIDIYNKNMGTDGDVSQNNLIPKHRVNFRERTKNKRIQELLEEKRNFLLRMKRGHAA